MAGKRRTVATAPLTTPLRTSLPIAGRRWAASQLAQEANQGPAERAVGTYQIGQCQKSLTFLTHHALEPFSFSFLMH